MKIEEAKKELVQNWGVLGSQWGINRTMSQIHALLLVSEKPLSTEDVMNELTISRGNAHTNLKDLVEWGLLNKTIISGDRKEYFEAEKDVWKIAVTVAKERKRRELEPMLKAIQKLDDELEGKSEEALKFHKLLKDIQQIGAQADMLINFMGKVENNSFANKLLKLVK
ncbi:MAG: transcriptional regulator [Bacteroidota bacterium]